MNISSAHWHLLLNHFPIVLSISGSGFLLFSFIFKKQHLQFAGLLLLIAASAFAYPAFTTGEGAEESVEHLAGVNEAYIEKHEEVGEIGLKVMLGAGALALISLVVLSMKKKATNTFILITLFAGLCTAGYMSYVGYTGGEIRHTEIQGDFGGKIQVKPTEQQGEHENE
ncbi:MAG: hypothetical protein ACKVPJ_10920 [Chitinophagales bacterium]